MNSKQLYKNKLTLLARQEAILNAATAAKRNLTKAEDEQFDQMSAEIVMIDRQLSVAAQQEEINRPVSEVVIPGMLLNARIGDRELSADVQNLVNFLGSRGRSSTASTRRWAAA
jgi:hypothetical protein